MVTFTKRARRARKIAPLVGCATTTPARKSPSNLPYEPTKTSETAALKLAHVRKFKQPGVVVVKILASHAVVQLNWKLPTAEMLEVVSQLGPPEDAGMLFRVLDSKGGAVGVVTIAPYGRVAAGSRRSASRHHWC